MKENNDWITYDLDILAPSEQEEKVLFITLQSNGTVIHEELNYRDIENET